MSKSKQQEMLEVLTRMSVVAAEILQNSEHDGHASEEDVKNLLTRLESSPMPLNNLLP